jgi:ferric-dicitrate binding protein FerR (iron transport regulator)
MLILPEGQSVAINNGESTLDYSNPGEIVINKDSIINNIEPTKISQLVIPHGSSSKVVLNDGSVVWLNAGSSLVYPSVFSNKTREVVLFGEAFFSVAKNVNKPFIVQTSALEIQVLGTEFNISAYPEDNIIQTVLKEGSVAIRRKGASRNENDIILIPNQLASFNKITKLSEVTNVNTEFYTSWTEGLLTFENRDLNRVIKSLERYYDINIQFDDPLLGSVKISGKLDLNQSKDEVFEYLSKVSSTTFVQISDNYYKIK